MAPQTHELASPFPMTRGGFEREYIPEYRNTAERLLMEAGRPDLRGYLLDDLVNDSDSVMRMVGDLFEQATTGDDRSLEELRVVQRVFQGFGLNVENAYLALFPEKATSAAREKGGFQALSEQIRLLRLDHEVPALPNEPMRLGEVAEAVEIFEHNERRYLRVYASAESFGQVNLPPDQYRSQADIQLQQDLEAYSRLRYQRKTGFRNDQMEITLMELSGNDVDFATSVIAEVYSSIDRGDVSSLEARRILDERLQLTERFAEAPATSEYYHGWSCNAQTDAGWGEQFVSQTRGVAIKHTAIGHGNSRNYAARDVNRGLSRSQDLNRESSALTERDLKRNGWDPKVTTRTQYGALQFENAKRIGKIGIPGHPYVPIVWSSGGTGKWREIGMRRNAVRSYLRRQSNNPAYEPDPTEYFLHMAHCKPVIIGAAEPGTTVFLDPVEGANTWSRAYSHVSRSLVFLGLGIGELSQHPVIRKGLAPIADSYASTVLIPGIGLMDRVTQSGIPTVPQPRNIEAEQVARESARVYLQHPRAVKNMARGLRRMDKLTDEEVLLVAQEPVLEINAVPDMLVSAGVLRKERVRQAEILARHGLHRHDLTIEEPPPASHATHTNIQDFPWYAFTYMTPAEYTMMRTPSIMASRAVTPLRYTEEEREYMGIQEQDSVSTDRVRQVIEGFGPADIGHLNDLRRREGRSGASELGQLVGSHTVLREIIESNLHLLRNERVAREWLQWISGHRVV